MTDMTRTAYIIDSAVAFTGAIKSAHSMARVLAPEVKMVLVLPPRSILNAEQLPHFHGILYLPLTNPSKSPLVLLRYTLDLFNTSVLLRRKLRVQHGDFLILNDFYLLHGVVLRALGYRGKILQWVRCDPARFAGSLSGVMLALAMRSANRIVAVSQFVAAKLPKSSKTEVIYDAIALPSPRPPLAAPEKTFLFVGNYIEGKGQDIALEAFAKAYSEDVSLRLHFCGGDMGLAKNRAYREALVARATVLGLSQAVRFSDFIADLSPLYATAYAALNCSFSESFSMTVLEASAAGLPVIATRCGGPEEIIVHGTTGLLVPVGDRAAISEAILKLAGDKTLAHRMGEAGTAHVAAVFNPDIFASALKQLCKRD